MIKDTVPTVREELIRKTVEFMIAASEKPGCADPVIAAAQAKALWTVTAGLVDSETSELLAAHADSIGQQSIKRYFAGNGNVLMLAYLPSGNGYVLQKIDPADGSARVLKASKAEVGFREQEMADLIDGLKRTGYRQI